METVLYLTFSLFFFIFFFLFFFLGLGKTFIAAVVMYNYYRWFPKGKIIFMAPTKPLVAQQIRACYEITGIPKDDTEEMTGKV